MVSNSLKSGMVKPLIRKFVLILIIVIGVAAGMLLIMVNLFDTVKVELQYIWVFQILKLNVL